MTTDTDIKQQQHKPKPAPATTRFIFIGDPKDNGAGSRAPRDEDANEFAGVEMYGIRFPKGKAVEVRLDRKIADTDRLTADKLRGNTHFFEGTEDELKTAKSNGEIVIKPAPKKVQSLVRNMGVRGVKQPNGTTLIKLLWFRRMVSKVAQ